MQISELEKLISVVAKLPGLGRRSARRAVLHLLERREEALAPLIDSLASVSQNVKSCPVCGNFDTQVPCAICADPKRDPNAVCVVASVADLWAMERAPLFKGKYHVLGGTLSALDGIMPEDLNIEPLVERVAKEQVAEVILALPATVEGQITAHYLQSRLKDSPSKPRITTLARGIPMGAELDYMDEGTLSLALESRKGLE